MEIKIPEKVDEILNQLHEHGFEAYIVGGCVRDALLGREPEDWDITTSAKPEQVKQLFRRTIDTGIQHGTVTVMMDKEGFEVTTYRIDGEYEDGRHPKEVEFTANLLEDLKRRDFTINAMAYSKEDGIVDAFDGMGDLKRKMVRCVGDAEERFSEDALRMLRAVRFSAQLDFTVEEKTKEAIVKKADTLSKISAERVRVELDKLLSSDHPERLLVGAELGITNIVLPEFDRMLATKQNHPHHKYDVGHHTIEAICRVHDIAKWEQLDKKELSMLSWTALLHDVGKPDCLTVGEDGITHFYGHPKTSQEMAHHILRRLRFDNHTIHMVCHLIGYHDVRFSVKKNKMRKKINQIGVDAMPYLFCMMEADILSQSEYQREEKLEALQQTKQMYEEILDAKECVSLQMLEVKGGDLLAEGFQKGKCIGEILQYLLEAVLETPENNEKASLLSLAKEHFPQYLSD